MLSSAHGDDDRPRRAPQMAGSRAHPGARGGDRRHAGFEAGGAHSPLSRATNGATKAIRSQATCGVAAAILEDPGGAAADRRPAAARTRRVNRVRCADAPVSRYQLSPEGAVPRTRDGTDTRADRERGTRHRVVAREDRDRHASAWP